MSCSRSLLFRLLCSLVIPVLLVLPVVSAPPSDAAMRQKHFAEGSQVLRWLLKKSEFEPVSDPTNLSTDPEHTILIVLGELRWLNNFPDDIKSFVNQGGALLVASDHRSDRGLLDLAGVRISGLHVEKRDNRKECHRGQSDRPFVTPATIGFSAELANPFSNLRVATNIPSYFFKLQDKLPAGIVPLAWFPNSSVYENSQGAWQSLPEDSNRAWLPSLLPELNFLSRTPFAVGGDLGKGRVLVLADHSVFITEMMLAEDCDNFDFAVKSLKWLSADKQRKQVMLVENGKVYENFNVTLRLDPPISPLKVLEQIFARRDQIVDDAQRGFARMEQSGKINNAALRLLGVREEDDFPRLQRIVLWLSGALLAFFGFYYLSNFARHRFGAETSFPTQAGPTLSQRKTVRIDANNPNININPNINLWGEARTLARQCFASRSSLPGQPKQPRLVGGSWWKRRLVRRRLRHLWTIAYGPTSIQVRPADWEHFLTDLDAFEQDIASGIVQMPTPR